MNASIALAIKTCAYTNVYLNQIHCKKVSFFNRKQPISLSKTTNVIILTWKNYMLKLNIYFVKENSSNLYVFITFVYSIFNLSTPTMLVPDGKQAGMYKWGQYTHFQR